MKIYPVSLKSVKIFLLMSFEVWRNPKGSRIRPIFFTDLFCNDFGIVIPRGRVID